MSKRIILLGILLVIALSVSSCAYHGGGYGSRGHPDGYGYYNNYYYNDPYSYRYRHDSTRYLYQSDGY